MAKTYIQNGSDPFGDLSPEAAAKRTWGGGDPAPELAGAKREKIELIDIDQIVPDPRQPRRAIPSAVRAASRTASVKDYLGHWFNISGAHALNVAGLIEGTAQLPEDFEPSPLLETFLKLVDLAASIHRDGLTNPITVSRGGGDTFNLETGERRWLSYHLLNDIYGEAYQRIPARIVPTLDVWRQATENNARDDLNAIGRARQLAILLMDVLGAGNFMPLEAFDHEQDYYAQVGDGELYRTPRGAAPKIISAMGLRNTRQLRDYRALLRLPREVWTRADDENWTERYIRDLDIADPDSDDSVPTGAESQNSSPPPPPAADVLPAPEYTPDSSDMTEFFQAISHMASNSSPVRRFAGWGRGDMNRLKRIAKWGEEIAIEDEIDRRKKLDEIGQALMALEEMKRRLGG